MTHIENSQPDARAPNRLIHESSPYLLQHAHNPVAWHAWGEEAFDEAREEDKPVFLSIGYSTCHWCHVMEKESFEDPEVAELMNEAFVSIKVDREERPDIDGVYMTVCQLMTGSGGWPLNVVLTPEGRPFFAGTYFPKTGRHGRPGMLELVPRIRELWRSRRGDVTESAERLTEALRRTEARASTGEPTEAHLRRGFEVLASSFDALQGGFGTAPRFPTPHNLSFLLRWWKRTGEERALDMVKTTLRAMRRGGIWDHVGFGFHRYSTDARWFVPHFEKMLYDQALLAIAYIEAFQATGEENFARTTREIFAYVLRDLTDERGGFHSAEDADSEGVEGKFYVWSAGEIERCLREAGLEEDVELTKRAFNVERPGNFADEATGKRTGANILHLRRPLREIAAELEMEEAELRARLEGVRRALLAAREDRVRPGLDDKVLTDWNGLMIAALARAGAAFGARTDDHASDVDSDSATSSPPSPAAAATRPAGHNEYLRAAVRAAEFLLGEMRDAKGRLLHRWREGEAGIAATADDYAFLVWGLIELYEATLQPRWLAEALRLNAEFIEGFWDPDAAGFFVTSAEGERLIVRRKESYDGALPSANSVALENLLRLARLTGDPGLEERAAALARAFSGAVESAPAGHTRMLCGIDFALGPAHEVVVVGSGAGADIERAPEPDRPSAAAATTESAGENAFLGLLQGAFLPRTVWLLRGDGTRNRSATSGAPTIDELAPFAAGMEPVDGRPAAYVCTNFACERPVTEPSALAELLGPPAGAGVAGGDGS